MRLDHDWFSRPVPDNVRIGAESWLYSAFAFLHYESRRPVGVRIGSHSGIYNGTFLELGRRGEVMIGDHCAIVGAIIRTNARIEIHDHVYIAHEVLIADTPWLIPPGAGDEAPAETLADPETSIVIGRNSWIATRAVVCGGARIGEGAIIGAGAVVDFEVPPYAIVGGNPASVVGWARPRRAPGG